jgi:hypothetical protein
MSGHCCNRRLKITKLLPGNIHLHNAQTILAGKNSLHGCFDAGISDFVAIWNKTLCAQLRFKRCRDRTKKTNQVRSQ